jgi:hypothetical protein
MEIIPSDKLVDILCDMEPDDDLNIHWGVGMLEQIRKANRSVDKLFFDKMADAGKRLDMEEVPRGNRVIKMWTFDDESL